MRNYSEIGYLRSAIMKCLRAVSGRTSFGFMGHDFLHHDGEGYGHGESLYTSKVVVSTYTIAHRQVPRTYPDDKSSSVVK